MRACFKPLQIKTNFYFTDTEKMYRIPYRLYPHAYIRLDRRPSNPRRLTADRIRRTEIGIPVVTQICKNSYKRH